MTRTARRFALLLGERFGVRTVFCDERLTTLDNPGADDAGGGGGVFAGVVGGVAAVGRGLEPVAGFGHDAAE